MGGLEEGWLSQSLLVGVKLRLLEQQLYFLAGISPFLSTFHSSRWYVAWIRLQNQHHCEQFRMTSRISASKAFGFGESTRKAHRNTNTRVLLLCKWAEKGDQSCVCNAEVHDGANWSVNRNISVGTGRKWSAPGSVFSQQHQQQHPSIHPSMLCSRRLCPPRPAGGASGVLSPLMRAGWTGSSCACGDGKVCGTNIWLKIFDLVQIKTFLFSRK